MKHSLFLILILAAACSSNKEKPETKKYSEDTNHAFEMIERGGTYYLRKAPEKNVPVPQIQAPPAQTQYQAPPQRAIPEKRRTVAPTMPPLEEKIQTQQPKLSVKENIVIEDKINYQEKPEEIKEQPAPHVKRNTTKIDERLIEINQNLAFYCMKHRKDPRYNGDEARCMSFVNQVMADCQKVHRIVNSKLLSCIQTKLRK